MIITALLEIPELSFFSVEAAAVSSGTEVSEAGSEAETVWVRVMLSTASVLELLAARFGSTVVWTSAEVVSEVVGGMVSDVEEGRRAESEVEDETPWFKADEMPDPRFPSRPPGVVCDGAALPAALLADAVFATFVLDATGRFAVLLAWSLLPPVLPFAPLLDGVIAPRPDERGLPAPLSSSLEPPSPPAAALLWRGMRRMRW